MYTFGLDIASYQGFPDFGALRDNHDFCISKVTGEGSYINPYWEKNRFNCRAAGMVFGGYDWVEPQSGQDPAWAARDYLRVLGTQQPGELLTVDFETPAWASGPLGRNIEPWMKTYLYTLKEVTAQEVWVYTGPYFLDETGARNWHWLGQDFLFWQAAPGAGMLPDNAPWPPGYPPFARCLIHQHQWHAHDAGVQGEFDRNRFQGTRQQLQALGYGGQTVDQYKAETVTPFVNSRGEAGVVINYGGLLECNLGVNIPDAGGSWRGTDGKTYDRSLLDNAFQPWVLRPDDGE